MSLRDEIAVYLTMSLEGNSYRRADVIIDLMREALTSDAACEAVESYLAINAIPVLVTWEQTQGIVTAALDAVTGEGETG